MVMLRSTVGSWPTTLPIGITKEASVHPPCRSTCTSHSTANVGFSVFVLFLVFFRLSDALTNAFNRRIFLFFLGGWARCSALSDRGRAALRCRIAGHPHSPVAVNAYIWPMSIRERGVGTGTSESFLDHFSHFFFFFSSSTSPHTRRVMSTCPTLRPLLIGS